MDMEDDGGLADEINEYLAMELGNGNEYVDLELDHLDLDVQMGTNLDLDVGVAETTTEKEEYVELDILDMTCPKCKKQLIWSRNFLKFEGKYHGLLSKICSNDQCMHITGQFKKIKAPGFLARRAVLPLWHKGQLKEKEEVGEKSEIPQPGAMVLFEEPSKLKQLAISNGEAGTSKGAVADPMDDPEINAYITDIVTNGSPVPKVNVVKHDMTFYKYMADLNEEDFIKELTALFPHGVPNLVKILDGD